MGGASVPGCRQDGTCNGVRDLAATRVDRRRRRGAQTHDLPCGGHQQQGGDCPCLPLSQASRPRGQPCSPGRARWLWQGDLQLLLQHGGATPGRAQHQAPGRSLCRGVSGLVPGSGPRVREAKCPGEAQQTGGARRGALAEVKDPPQRRSFSNSCTAGGPQQSQSRPLPHRGGCWQLWLCPAPTLPRPLLTVLPEGCGMWRGNQYEEKSYSSLRSGACAGETGSTPRPPARRWSFLCSDCTARLHGSLDSPQGWPQGPEGGSGWAHAAVGEVLSANLSLSLQVPRLQPWEPGDKQLGD